MTPVPSAIADALRDRYLLERELGRGGMATVYLARDLRHDRRVALKVLHPELAQALGPERFLREIKVTARLDHPHILPVFESGAADGLLWYTMPYVEGESLRDRLGREVQLPIEDALRITREVADALDCAHRHGVVHRDIKPENILLAQGHARVADFGVAQALENAGGDRLTVTGLAIGTPLYMSPEQTGGGELDGRSDLYSLGCVLYEMLTGEPPFTGRTPQAIVAKRLSEVAPRARLLRPTLPPAVDAALAQALAGLPADRFVTIGEFAAALQSTGPAVQTRRLPLLAVLALYALAAIAVLGIVRLLSSALGLPDWVVPGALVLLLVGLPIMLGTAVLQGRHTANTTTTDRGRQPSSPHWLTWRRALWGGAAAFAGLGVATGGYMALRAWGVGPVGTLQAAGVLKDRERLLLADFGTRQVDSALGGVLTEALRIDLAQSLALTLMPPVQVAEVLRRMHKPATARLDPALAREVAVREGIKGVVTGEIAKAGTQYVLSAQVISANDGEVFTAHRATAPDSTALIAAVDHLSKKLRAKIGESLRSVNREAPLERVTTASLPALRQYSAAVRAGDYEGNWEKAIARLEEAIALDTGFAMAYRTLGMYAANAGKMDILIDGYSAAMQRLDRLTERERHLTLGDYYQIVTAEFPKAVTAYQAVLDDHPGEREALNNLGNVYLNLHQPQQAESLYQRAIAADSSYVSPYNNLILVQIALKRLTEAQATYERATRNLPGVPLLWFLGIHVAQQQGNYATTAARARALEERFGADPRWRAEAERHLAMVAAIAGRFNDAERYWRAAMAARVETFRPDDYLAEAFLLASMFVTAGERARGLRELDRAVARYPLDSLKPLDRPYLKLAMANSMGGRADRARALVAQYERVVEPRLSRGGGKAELELTWAHIALAERRWSDAIAKFRQSVSQGTPAVAALPELGRAYELSGQTDSAAAVYERYLDTPDVVRSGEGVDAIELARIHRRLGELYEQRGEREKARNSYTRFIELWKDCDPELRPRVAEARRRLLSARQY